MVTDYTSVNTENSSVCVYVRARPPDPSWTLEDDDASVEEDKFQNPLQATLAGGFVCDATLEKEARVPLTAMMINRRKRTTIGRGCLAWAAKIVESAPIHTYELLVRSYIPTG